jgi:hypothetical protein
VIIDAGEVQLFRTYSAAREGLLLVFGVAGPRRADDLPVFEHNEEVSEMLVVQQPCELAFPLHTRVMWEYFRENAG